MMPVDVSADLESVSSVLIVSCPVCPPVSLAIQRNEPLIEVFKHGLKTGAFEDHVKEIREPLEKRGVRTGVFCTYAPVPTMCLWTKGQRTRLLKRARDFEAVLVLGCESATYSVRQALGGSECRIVEGMRMTGITNATLKFQPPMNLCLEEQARVCAGEGAGKEAS
jgi:hypothetical protein